ncbi:hypothetical protein GH714_029009 [Hevea brasiliensis]|nr:hypothetical protein GH714_029009 [Hevea brasiliensis]
MHLLVLLYVDDMIITGDNEVEISMLKNELSVHFEMKNLGEVGCFLGLEVEKSDQGYFVSQKRYAEELLQRFGMGKSKEKATPMEPHLKLMKNEGQELKDAGKLKQLVGSLIYLTTIRPEIAYSVGVISQFMQNPRTSHLDAAKRILRYVKGTTNYGLLYKKGKEREQCVVHRDIKSSNIMLDSNFNAKLGDFGLARMMEHGKGLQMTVLAGTMGYMAPECLRTGKASRESDVYSFGVVALEIACGRRPINSMANEEEVQMVSWVWELYGRGKLLEAADPRLCGDFDKQEMKKLMIVGLWCVHPDKI